MLAIGQDELLCDFAQFYHIYDLFALDVSYCAILACGLRHDSRIYQKLNDVNCDLNTLLLAQIADKTALNLWIKTKDAQNGKNKPKSFVTALSQKEEITKEKHFTSGADFMKEWRRINGN